MIPSYLLFDASAMQCLIPKISLFFFYFFLPVSARGRCPPGDAVVKSASISTDNLNRSFAMAHKIRQKLKWRKETGQGSCWIDMHGSSSRLHCRKTWIPANQQLKQFNPSYQLPRRNNLMYTELPEMYTETRDLISEHLKDKTFYACTMDLWTSRAANTFITCST